MWIARDPKTTSAFFLKRNVTEQNLSKANHFHVIFIILYTFTLTSMLRKWSSRHTLGSRRRRYSETSHRMLQTYRWLFSESICTPSRFVGLLYWWNKCYGTIFIIARCIKRGFCRRNVVGGTWAAGNQGGGGRRWFAKSDCGDIRRIS